MPATVPSQQRTLNLPPPSASRIEAAGARYEEDLSCRSDLSNSLLKCCMNRIHVRVDGCNNCINS